MIETFSVQNYRSIKHEQTISFLANNKIQGGSNEYLLSNISDSVKLLKFCVLYGYNASGKTNLLLALDFLRSLVVNGNTNIDVGTGFVPFVLDEHTKQAPGTFILKFYLNKVRYTYQVVVGTERILLEELSFQPMGRKALIFSRTYNENERISTFEFGTRCDLTTKEKGILDGNTIDTITTLFAYQKSNIHSDAIEGVVEYFKKTVMSIITPSHSLRRWAKNRVIEDPKREQFFIDFLQKADFQIGDLEISKETILLSTEMLADLKTKGAPDSVIKQLQSERELELTDLLFLHETSNGNHYIPFEEESQGTLRYFGLGSVIHELVVDGGVAPIDELEASLHPDLVAFLLQMFLMNTSESQIIATTHNQGIMELDYMRSDMIWLCEKDEEGASKYYSVQEFGLHKKINIANAYRTGKLGAKPYLGSAIFEDLSQ